MNLARTIEEIEALMQRQARLLAAREITNRLMPDERQEFVLAMCLETLGPPTFPRMRADQAKLSRRLSAVPSQLLLPPTSETSALAASETASEISAATSLRSAPKVRRRSKKAPKVKSKTDQAEAFIQAHPEGVAFKEIVMAIGQESSAAASTLQYLKTKRRTVANRDNRWYPATPTAQAPAQGVGGARKSAYREAILSVLAEGAPLGTMDIFKRVKAVLPQATYPSAASEIKRMHRRKQIVQRGEGTNGRLYAIKSAARAGRQAVKHQAAASATA